MTQNQVTIRNNQVASFLFTFVSGTYRFTFGFLLFVKKC